MPSPSLPLAAVVLAALVPGIPGAPPAAPERPRYAQFVVQERVVMRVPRMRIERPVEWVEKKGPKCVPLAGLAGALVVERDAVDLVHVGGSRVRARLDKDCPALAFYSGLYIRPTADGRICADRDAIRSRSGRVCEIDKFRTLVAKR